MLAVVMCAVQVVDLGPTETIRKSTSFKDLVSVTRDAEYEPDEATIDSLLQPIESLDGHIGPYVFR